MKTLLTIKAISRDELLLMWRNKIAVISIFILLVLLIISLLTALAYKNNVNEAQFLYQNDANAEFAEQPDRHPHRVAHFGHFLFRPMDPLAAFDMGINPYAGHVVFLEAHQQNTANFSDAKQSSLLIRFGQLSPAFVLQVLAPLLLIFIGHASIARERQNGTLRLMLSQGVSGTNIFLGKLFALSCVVLIIIAPAVCTLIWFNITAHSSFSLTAILIAAYIIWLMIWALGITLISAFLNNNRDALLILIAVWTIQIILIPRLIPDFINSEIPLRSKIETQVNVNKELKALGDSHNENDPYFANFKQKILQKYGVDKVEDLPVNYKGLVMEEGERMTTELYNRYNKELFQQQNKQNKMVDIFSWINPILALKRLSMTASASDLESFNHFLIEAEKYRYKLVQYLNHLETSQIRYIDDADTTKENRLDQSYWKQFPEFNYQAFSSTQRVKQMSTPFMILSVWFILLMLLIKPTGRYIERKIK
ncbi:DUF3526 domain-containing protein [Acinetobacter sp. Marseille-Q1618]|uniref:ABC transporter permease n=1 Tax=Acinetobacter sp. Marseille-Q1618 TaxID=2697502 RepID=UPI00156E18C5|nr:DUF3526 domain-containing protein [Acinetobacter sp. Marseille-Q1618]